jgi:hypothetical protein
MMELAFSALCTLNVTIIERSCEVGSASSVFERSVFQISEPVIFVLSRVTIDDVSGGSAP